MTSTNNVASFLLEGKQPERIALATPTGTHSYGELQKATSRFASHLIELGCTPGERVLLVGENSLFWVAAYLGILEAGLVCVPLPVNAPAENFEYIRRTTEARVAAVQARSAKRLELGLRDLNLITDRDCAPITRVLSQVEFSRLGNAEEVSTAREVTPDGLAALMFTSGSTGKPRGVMVSHRNIRANTESIIQYLGLTEADRIMTVLPFHYCFGTSLLHTHLRVGGSLVLDSRFMYPETILQRMIESECTGFAGVPSHFQILLRNSSLKKKNFPHLRYVQQAGGNLAPTFIRELRSALPGTQVFVMYGQTEATARLSYLPPDCLDTKLGSIGKGIPGVTLRVVDENGHDVAPGEVGEIVAHGDNVALGYWRSTEETLATFRNGTLHTGDLATVDQDGFIFIVDRAKDFLKIGGVRISCRQIEDQLLECDELLEAAVVGMPDEILGEAVKAFVVPRNPNNSELREHLRSCCPQHMAPQVVPKEIITLRSLPKNDSGKVIKAALKE